MKLIKAEVVIKGEACRFIMDVKSIEKPEDFKMLHEILTKAEALLSKEMPKPNL